MIELPPLGALDLELWQALLDIADRMPSDWTLVGGQMVLLELRARGELEKICYFLREEVLIRSKTRRCVVRELQ